jgi:hypothetical protein
VPKVKPSSKIKAGGRRKHHRKPALIGQVGGGALRIALAKEHRPAQQMCMGMPGDRARRRIKLLQRCCLVPLQQRGTGTSDMGERRVGVMALCLVGKHPGPLCIAAAKRLLRPGKRHMLTGKDHRLLDVWAMCQGQDNKSGTGEKGAKLDDGRWTVDGGWLFLTQDE